MLNSSRVKGDEFMSKGFKTPAELISKYWLTLFIVISGLILFTGGILINMELEDLLSNGLNVIAGLAGLLILIEFKNRTLTLGWTIYLSGLIIDLVDEIVNLPVWLDNYYEHTAEGIGLLVIVLGFYMIVKDKHEAADHFRGLSNQDELTGLYNHRYFYEYFQKTSVNSKSLILLFCDLDYFKTINDLFGHITGDSVLKKTAQIIKQTAKEKGKCFRYGGEEFIVLLESCTMEQALIVAQELNKKVSTCNELQQYAVYFPVTLSIGIASYPENAGSPQDLVEKADRAMYASKQKGRNQISIYNPENDTPEQSNIMGLKRKMLINSVISLASAIDAKDKYTGRHSEFVTRYALQIAEALNISEEDKFRLRMGAVLHDCGKIGVPDDVINNPGGLSGQEFESIKNHTLLGYNIIKHITDDSEIISCVVSHHERWDGNGYPHGLSGLSIPLFARIITIADAFHAMTSDRPYRTALTWDQALKEMKKSAGTQFDPDLVKCFIELQLKQGNNLDHDSVA